MAKVSRSSSFGIRMGRRVTRQQRARQHQKFWERMKPFVATAVIESFVHQGMRNPTVSALRERTNAAKELVDMLRQDHGWSFQRIRDHLSYILRCKLAGIELPLDTLLARSSW